MANKRPKPEEVVSKLRQVEVLTGKGMPRLDAIRQIRVTEQPCYRWKKTCALSRHWSKRQWRRAERARTS